MAMGRPKSTVVLDSELREQLDSLAKSRSLPGWLSASSQDYLVERLWEERPRDCRTTGDEQDHGRPVATTVPAQGVSGLYYELRPGRPARLATSELPN